MGCLLVLLGAFAPRILFLIIWIARPVYVDAVFDTFIFPLLGLIFLPFTTLIYLLMEGTVGGISGFDWVWLALAVILDLTHYAQAYGARNEMPGRPGRTGGAPAT